MELLLKNKKPLLISMLVGNAIVLALIILVCLTNAIGVADKAYKGWEVIFYGPAQGFAYGQYNFKTNWFAAIFTVLAAFGTLLTDYEWRDLKKKARVGFLGVTVVSLVLFAVSMFILRPVVSSLASTGMQNTIKYAILDGTYKVSALPIVAGVLALLQAVLCTANLLITLKSDEKAK